MVAEPGLKALLTTYLHDATVSQTHAEYRGIYNSFCSNAACSHRTSASFQRVLNSVTPIKSGDTSTYVIDNGTITISCNNQIVLTLADPEYAKGFLAALTGPASPTTACRDGLLGNA